MPSTINGCGTWYYGKTNRRTHQGVCSQCHHQTELKSYDTRLWAVVLYIPVFPLGRKRVIEECSVCSRHGVMPLDDWHRVQRRCQETVAAYQQSPADTELAKEALLAIASYRDVDGFVELAKLIEQHLTAHAPTMTMVGGAYMLFNRRDDAQRVLRASLAVTEQDEELREALAECLMQEGKPDEAEPLLQHIIDKGIPDRAGALYQLAQTYQMQGRHPHAIASFEHAERVNPLMAQDPTFQQLRNASEERLGSTAKVVPTQVVAQAKRSTTMKKLRRLAPVAAALLLAAYLVVAWVQGMSRQVFVVNGLGKPYTVLLNGERYDLTPQRATAVRLPEGRVRVEIADAPAGIEPETVTIATSLWTRPFSGATFVINPDRAAVLEKIRVFYADIHRSSHQPQVTLAAGQVLHRFDGLDYVFEPLPDQITVSDKSDAVARDALGVYGQDYGFSPAMALMNAMDELGPKAAATAAKVHLLMEPGVSDDEYLSVLGRTMEPDAMRDFLGSRLEQRPVQMQWHRAYQQAMRAADRLADAEQQYSAMLEKEPGNSDLMYLLARVVEAPQRGADLCQRAIAAPKPSGWAHYWLGGYYLAAGEFESGAEHFLKATQMLPEVRDVRQLAREGLMAAERWDTLCQMLEVDVEADLTSAVIALPLLAYVHQQRGDVAAMDAALERLRLRLTEIDPRLAAAEVAAVGAVLQYAAGETSAYFEAVKDSPRDQLAMAGLLTAGDLLGARRRLERMQLDDDSAAVWNLLVYLAAKARSDADAAEAHLMLAIQTLQKGDDTERAYAELLSGGSLQTLDRGLHEHDDAGRKAAVLVSAGLAQPACRDKAFALAAKLNYDKRFPHLLLKEAIGAGKN